MIRCFSSPDVPYERSIKQHFPAQEISGREAQMDIRDVAEIVIEGMKKHAEELQLAGQ
ncbi:MAG: hypothetical protein IJL78_00570 [Lachnospiraceae bacterium]|nr:hypothetical protein [Lachnospiraceae bacterium]